MSAGALPELFGARERRLVELEHYLKYFLENTRKRGLTGKHSRVFSPRYSYNYILNRKVRAFFQKSRHFFDFQKNSGEASTLLPSCGSARVAEYVSISLNMPKYPWKCFNKMLGLINAWLSYIFGWLLKMLGLLKNHGFEYGTVEFRIYLIMFP